MPTPIRVFIGTVLLVGLASCQRAADDAPSTAEAFISAHDGRFEKDDEAEIASVEFAGSDVTDADLSKLKKLTSLKALYLQAFRVTDAGLQELQQLASLQELYLDCPKITEEGINKLSQALPGLNIKFNAFESVAAVPEASKVRDAHKAMINAAVERYFIDNNVWPRDDLSDIGSDPEYFPEGVPQDPVDGSSYRLHPQTHRVLYSTGQKPDGLRILESPGKKAAAVETVPIYVALQNINSGDAVDDAMVSLQEWPQDKLPVGAVTKWEDIAGRRARTAIFEGEPLNDGKFLAKGETREPIAGIPPGMRLKTVAVDASKSAAGLLSPGDRVDVQVFIKRNEQAGIANPVTKIILQNIRVYAVDQAVERTSEEAEEPSVAKTVSLVVTPEQASRIALAESTGEVSLIPRAPSAED